MLFCFIICQFGLLLTYFNSSLILVFAIFLCFISGAILEYWELYRDTCRQIREEARARQTQRVIASTVANVERAASIATAEEEYSTVVL